MTLADVTQKMTEMAQKSPNALGGSTVKFVFPEGVVFIDDKQQVSNEDKPADCELKITMEDLTSIVKGDLNPMAAVMFGKLKIGGDMGVAMKLQSLFS
jgi:putative sterol carrier protein